MIKTYESCAAVAAKYQSRQELREKANSEYQWLGRNKLLDQACAHMTLLHRTITDSCVAKIASKYTSRRAFKLGDQSYYQAARKRGILDSVCAHMDLKHRDLSNEDITAVAKEYSSRSEFDRLDSGAYQTATKRGILDQVCAHMDSRGCRRLSNDEIAVISKQYSTRRNLILGDFGAYTTALRRGIIDSVCAHMGERENGFNPKQPAILYHIQLTKPCGEVLHKVGITNRSAKIRMSTFGLHRGIKSAILHEIKFPNGADARTKEKAIHKAMSEFRYQGAPIMENGNTEVFSRDATIYLQPNHP